MSSASPLPMFAATLAAPPSASSTRTAAAPAEHGTDFARVAADLAAELQMGGSAPAQTAATIPDTAMASMLPAAGTPVPATAAGAQPQTSHHAIPVETPLDMRRFAKPADAVVDPALAAASDDVAALLDWAPQRPAKADTAASPDDALSQQMFALLSGLAPPTAPADATPASDAADVLTSMRTPAMPMPMPMAPAPVQNTTSAMPAWSAPMPMSMPMSMPMAPAPAQTTTSAVLGPAVTFEAVDVGNGISAPPPLDLSSRLPELPAMPRATEPATLATPVVAAAGTQIAAAALHGVEREDTAAIEGVDVLPPGAPLAVHAARGPNAPVVVASPLQMPSLADAGFDDELGARMAWVAEQKLGHAEIRLNPEHLGRIDLKIQLEGTRVSAEFNSANADVRQALEATLPRLREMLGQHGLQLGQADVGQRQQNAPQSQGQSAPVSGSVGGDEGASANVAASTPAQVVRNRGLLDEYA